MCFCWNQNYISYSRHRRRCRGAIDIPFETEMELRVRGTSRTPDILFSCPVAIQVPKRILSPANQKSVQGIKDKHMGTTDTSEEDFVWKMICWIDSKVS
jgi:hypothetical protein